MWTEEAFSPSLRQEQVNASAIRIRWLNRLRSIIYLFLSLVFVDALLSDPNPVGMFDGFLFVNLVSVNKGLSLLWSSESRQITSDHLTKLLDIHQVLKSTL